MGIYIERNFYNAAYLKGQGYILFKIERQDNGKSLYHFSDNELLRKDLEEFRNNKEMQFFIRGIIDMKNIYNGKNLIQESSAIV